MDKEILNYGILWHLNIDKEPLLKDECEIDYNEYVEGILSLSKQGFLCGVTISYNEYEEVEDIEFLCEEIVTLEGKQYLNNNHKIIEKNILLTLLNNGITNTFSHQQISNQILIDLHESQLDTYINNLESNGLILTDSNQTYRLSKSGLGYINSGFSDTYLIVKNTRDIADNTAQTNNILNTMGSTLDAIVNSMGAQHQKSMIQQVKNNQLLSKLTELLQSKEPNKETKIKDFLKSLSGDIAVQLITEFSKKALGL